ncbi:hypothetical protein PU683_17965 [Kosakonia cowanii]|uniref:hypothetical protein n=1 Tax=Kosakonia cowanii TaxID=208223 RepID=UPI0023F9F29F|nr:hypothetical protein [Kosakonia cowanii]MDF7761411.1 hypothetical protein [Kosakonia cowanii]
MSDPFSVVRQAHRICAAYYQQILPLINETASHLGATFFRRDHWSFTPPPQRNSNPFTCWEWDFLPLMDVSFAFGRQQTATRKMGSEDFVLDFRLITDSALAWEQRNDQYGKNENPLASALKTPPDKSESFLAVFLFASGKKGNYDSPYTLWNSYSGYPKTDGTVTLAEREPIKAIGFRIDLYELTSEGSTDMLVERINAHLAILRADKTA